MCKKIVKIVLVVIAVILAASCSTKKTTDTKAEAGEKTAGFEPDANMPRSDVPNEYKWSTAVFFKDDAAWEAEYESVRKGLDYLNTFRDKIKAPADINGILDLYFPLHKRATWLAMYANLNHDTDQLNEKYTAMHKKALQLINDFMSASSFIRQAILKADPNEIQTAYESDGGLSKYKVYIDDILRRKSRVLSEKEERLLTMAGDNLWAEIDLNEIPSDHEKNFQAFMGDVTFPTIKDEDGKEVELALANYAKYRRSPVREVRKNAVEGLLKTLKKYQNLLASTMAGQVSFSLFLSRARGYDRVLDAYLDKDHIDTGVYDNLIETTQKNLNKLHRYIALRKKVMGLADIHLYDLYVPLVEEVNFKFPYEKNREILLEALKPLGGESLAVLDEGLRLENGWIDLYPNKGKAAGAFCASAYGAHPFVKLNYLGDFDDLSTLAHEFGHALHSHNAMNSQPYWNSSYIPFLAEIASTTNETLLSDYMIRNAKTKEEKVFYLNDMLDRIRTTIFRQALFAEFEKKVHESAEKGEPLTAEKINGIYRGLISQYYGPDFTIDADDELEWAYVPHFYYKYYVYSYATGLSAGIAFAEKLKNGDPEAVEAYLGMLKGGRSKPPLMLLKEAGVDMTSPDPIQAAYNLFDKTLTEMEKLMQGG